MTAGTGETLRLNSEEAVVISELLASERARLLIEIRHTDHRTFREELRHRLELVENLMKQCR